MKIKKYLKMLLLFIMVYPINVFAEGIVKTDINEDAKEIAHQCFYAPGVTNDANAKILIPYDGYMYCRYSLDTTDIRNEVIGCDKYKKDKKGNELADCEAGHTTFTENTYYENNLLYLVYQMTPITENNKTHYEQEYRIYFSYNDIEKDNNYIPFDRLGGVADYHYDHAKDMTINSTKVWDDVRTQIEFADMNKIYGCPKYLTYYEYYDRLVDKVSSNYSKYKQRKIVLSNSPITFDKSNDMLQWAHKEQKTTANYGKYTFDNSYYGENDSYIEYSRNNIYNKYGSFYYMNPDSSMQSKYGYTYDDYFTDEEIKEYYSKYKKEISEICTDNSTIELPNYDPQTNPQVEEEFLVSCDYKYGQVTTDNKCVVENLPVSYYLTYKDKKIQQLEIRIPKTYTNTNMLSVDRINYAVFARNGTVGTRIDYDSSNWYENSQLKEYIKYDPNTKTWSCSDELTIVNSAQGNFVSGKTLAAAPTIDNGTENTQTLATGKKLSVANNVKLNGGAEVCKEYDISHVGEKKYYCNYWNMQRLNEEYSTPNIQFYTRIELAGLLNEEKAIQYISYPYKSALKFSEDLFYDKYEPPWPEEDELTDDSCFDLLYIPTTTTITSPGDIYVIKKDNYESTFVLDETMEDFTTKLAEYCEKNTHTDKNTFPVHYCHKGKCKYNGPVCVEVNNGKVKESWLEEPHDPDIFEVDENGCPKIVKLPVIFLKKVIFNVLEIFVPILLIVMASVDLVKYLLNPDDDKKHQTLKKCVNKFIIAIAFFFVTTIVTLILNTVAKTTNINNTSSWRNCWVSIK